MFCVRADDRPIEPDVVDTLRETLSQHAGDDAACSQLAGALVCRYLGVRVESALQAFRAAWATLRPACFGKPAVAPRIWAT
jgi:urease accessory protein